MLVGDDGPSPYLDGVIGALHEHPGFVKVAVVGLGAVAVAGITASGVAVLSQSQFAASVPTASHGITGVVAGMSTAAKVGVLAGTGAVVIGGGAVVAVVLDGDTAGAVEFADSVTVDVPVGSEESYPLDTPPPLVVALGPAVDTNEVGIVPPEATDGFVSREVGVWIDGSDDPLLTDRVILPTSIDQDGRFVVATLEAPMGDIVTAFPPGGFCYREPDQTDVVGVWEYTGDDGLMTVDFLVDVIDGAVDPDVQVVLEGTAQLELFEGVEDDIDLGRCPEVERRQTFWVDD